MHPLAQPSFEPYRVLKKQRESATICSFWLAPAAGGALVPFVAGQHLTLRLPDNLIRNYTISSSPACQSGYRISVKRHVPPGRASSWLHDCVQEGDCLEVLAPRGDFYLRPCPPQDMHQPVLLLSGGVGLTPMVSMLHALATDTRQVTFIHACKNSAEHAFADEVSRLAQHHPNTRVFLFYSAPTASDRLAATYLERRIALDFLTELQPRPGSACYLCGPPHFMQSVYAALLDYGMDAQHIHYEFFGTSCQLLPAPRPGLAIDIDAAQEDQADSPVVEFKNAGKTLVWNDFSGSLLEFAEQNGIYPAYSCREGICSTCESRILAGEVDYFAEPLDPPREGHALLCISRPGPGKLVIDL